MNKAKAVIGLGFGDEGKGVTTNILCLQNPEALVVRYSGGQQAGHTVITEDLRHVFSNFGSGTLSGNDTYWSPYCTVDPVGVYNELQILLAKGITPQLYIDGKCPITTLLDKEVNQINDKENGTCGVGVGTTLQREKDHYSLLFEDLFNPEVLKIKLGLIEDYYNMTTTNEMFLYCCNYLVKSTRVKLVYGIPKNRDLIFEGSQGLLLDQNYGFFPHVTRSNTGSPNILDMAHIPEFYCVTRAYQTRHGNGPMTNLEHRHNLNLNPYETNVNNEFQGNFKVSLLDVSLLEYGIMKDGTISRHRDNLVITCMDQVEDDYRFTYKGEIITSTSEAEFVGKINSILKFSRVFVIKSGSQKTFLNPTF